MALLAMSRYGVRDAKVEELSGIRVGMVLANFYEDDTMWHERLVLWPSMEDPRDWYILTPDEDYYVERFDLNPSDGPKRVRMKGVTFHYWSRFSEPVYRFSSPVDDASFKKYIQIAIDEIKKGGLWNESKVPRTILNLKGEEVSATAYLGRILVTKRVIEKGRGAIVPALGADLGELKFAGELEGKVKPVSYAPEGFVWISMENIGMRQLGEELDVIPGYGVMVKDDLALILLGGEWMKGRLCRVEEVPRFVEELKKRYEKRAHAEDLQEQLNLGQTGQSAPPAEKDEDGEAAEKVSEDARILAVDYDNQEERHKEWKIVSQECAEYSFKDWPLEGPLCTLHMVKQMHRTGGTPKAWLQNWARFKQVPEGDRIMFELRTLVEAIEYGGSYDQLNLASLASFECISRRIMAIVDAFGAGTAGAPDWGAARIFTGYKGPEDIVMPQLKQWASKKGKEEVELYQARNKMREARRGVIPEEAAGAVAEGSVPSTAAPKQKGKKGQGRGLEPPAQQ